MPIPSTHNMGVAYLGYRICLFYKELMIIWLDGKSLSHWTWVPCLEHVQFKVHTSNLHPHTISTRIHYAPPRSTPTTHQRIILPIFKVDSHETLMNLYLSYSKETCIFQEGRHLSMLCHSRPQAEFSRDRIKAPGDLLMRSKRGFKARWPHCVHLQLNIELDWHINRLIWQAIVLNRKDCHFMLQVIQTKMQVLEVH